MTGRQQAGKRRDVKRRVDVPQRLKQAAEKAHRVIPNEVRDLLFLLGQPKSRFLLAVARRNGRDLCLSAT